VLSLTFAASHGPTLPVGGLIGRVLLAAALGGVIGFEREFRDQPAGFRTHILVSLGAALFTMAGAYGVSNFVAAGGVSFDPTRIAAQVVTGIGFLGAGAILSHGLTVRGLTTAAALWVTAAVGVAVGLGYFAGALTTSVTTVVALVVLKPVESTLIDKMRRGRRQCLIKLGPQLHVAELLSVFQAHHYRIIAMGIDPVSESERQLSAIVAVPPHTNTDAIDVELRRVEGVMALEWN
jgi:putative Mg2+ transporter-C (MgtC) family protein